MSRPKPRNIDGNDRIADNVKHYPYEPRMYYDEYKAHQAYGTYPFSMDRYSKNQIPPAKADSDTGEKDEGTLKAITSDWAQNTSLQAVPWIDKYKEWYYKLFWTVIFVIATGAFLGHAFYIINLYLQFKTNTAVTINNQHLPFPSVTLCNINPISNSKVDTYGNALLKQLIADVAPMTEFTNNEDGTTSSEGLTTDMEDSSAQEATTVVAGRRRLLQQQTTPEYYNYYYYPYSYDDYTGQADYSAYANPINWTMFNGAADYSYIWSDPTASTKAKLNAALKGTTIGLPNENRTAMGTKLTNMLISCSFDGVACSSADFEKDLDIDYGNCFTFNGPSTRNKSRLSRRSGARFGLDLVLFIHDMDYLKGFQLGRGVRIQLHAFDTMQFVADYGLSIAPGRQAYVAIRALEQKRLGGKYGGCDDGGTYVKYYGNKFLYTLTGCINTCLDRTVASVCKCFRETQKQFYNSADLQRLKPCTSTAELECIKREDNNILDKKNQCGCKQACKSLNFEESVTFDDWPEPDMFYTLVDRVCTKEPSVCDTFTSAPDAAARETLLRKNFVKIKIFYKDLNVEKIVEEPSYEPAQFASDLGGAIGLWIGVTFVTVIEIFQFTCQVCMLCCCTSRKVKRSAEQNPREKKQPNTFSSGQHGRYRNEMGEKESYERNNNDRFRSLDRYDRDWRYNGRYNDRNLPF